MEKENTTKIHEFDPQIYPRLLWVTYNCPAAVLEDLFEGKIEEMDKNSDADVLNCRRLKPDVKGGILIRFRSKKDMTAKNIAHESTHAALEIFDYVGARISYDNQEPYAYLVGWIADCINKVKNNKIK